MDLTAARQKLVASNIANASTPGYRAKDFDFHAEFVRSLDAGKAGAPPGSPAVIEVDGLATGNDGNNVSLEREVRLLSENSIRFQLATQLAQGEFGSLKTAIQDGKS